MIRMEYPKANLDSFTDPADKILALKRQVDILTDNLQIVLDSIESDLQDIIPEAQEMPDIPDPVEVDSSLSSSSENPVQNKVIKTALDNKIGMAMSSGTHTVGLSSSTGFTDTGLEVQLTPGTYILVAALNFNTGTGRRGARWYYSSDSNWQESAVSHEAMSGANTRMQVTRIIKVSSGVTIKLQAFQNTGSALNCTISYRYIKFS